MAIKPPVGSRTTPLGYNDRMVWIYLSPHFDDVALSCGGLVWEQVQSGDMVSIWTICAGEPPPSELSPFAQELHRRWEAGENAAGKRKVEDMNSCQILGASYRHLPIPDCIYRRDPQTGEYLYASEAALNGRLNPADSEIIESLKRELSQSASGETIFVSPLGLGNHVDHQLTRQVAEGLSGKHWYYADYPYVLRSRDQLGKLEQNGWLSKVFTVSAEGLLAWQEAIAVHGSQISTFWANPPAMRQAVSDYFQWYGGVRLWRMPPVE